MDWLSPLEDFFGFAVSLLDRVPVIRVILAFLMVFFLPGFTWSLFFFRQISLLERLALSLVMSIAIVTLSLLVANFILGIPLSGQNTVLLVILVTIIPVLAYYLKRYLRRRGNGTAIDSGPGV